MCLGSFWLLFSSSLLSLKHAGIGASHRDISGGAGNVETFVRIYIYHLFNKIKLFFAIDPIEKDVELKALLY